MKKKFSDVKIPDKLWPQVYRFTRWRAHSIGYCYGLNEAEKKDLQQELLIDLERRWHRYDPQRSPEMAFVRMVVKNRLRDFTKNKIRRVRNLKERLTSLNETVTVKGDDGNEEVERITLVSEADNDNRRQIRRRSLLQTRELQQDVQALVAKLPEDLRQICEAVMQYSVPKAAEKLNMPQSTLRDKLKGLRLYFAELQGYLDTRSA